MSDPIPSKIGKYRIIKEVGRGATAVVYLAESPDSQKQVAVKHVRFHDKGKDEAKWNRRLIKLLKAEAAVAQRLDHPNIIRIFDAVIDPNEAYVVMEFFPGKGLDEYCKFDNLLPVNRVIGIIFKCCLALDYAFKNGIVHRDIKPANIMVDDEDNVKITDFGLALNVSKKLDRDSTFIMGVGSPAYMSPEQIKNYPLNQKTDLYSLGVVLFHLLTGRLPFRANNAAQLIYKIINADPPSINLLCPDLPETMDKIIRKALEKDLYSRYRNGIDFAKELSAVRYKIFDDQAIVPDSTLYSILRSQRILIEFDEIELWEIIRISTLRKVEAHAMLLREKEPNQTFGLLIEGEIEMSCDGRRVYCLGPGEVFGILAWMDEIEHCQMETVVTLVPSRYLEINPAALALATEEVQEKIRKVLSTIMARRLGGAMRQFAQNGPPAVEGKAVNYEQEGLQLLDT